MSRVDRFYAIVKKDIFLTEKAVKQFFIYFSMMRARVVTILVSMTYLNTLNERGIFDGLKIYLLKKQFSYRQLLWITGGLAFLLSTFINGLTVGLLMGTIALAVGKQQPKFVALACVNIVIGANAGGAMSPLGGISTLFVWQKTFCTLLISSL